MMITTRKNKIIRIDGRRVQRALEVNIICHDLLLSHQINYLAKSKILHEKRKRHRNDGIPIKVSQKVNYTDFFISRRFFYHVAVLFIYSNACGFCQFESEKFIFSRISIDIDKKDETLLCNVM